jgi:DNA-binding NtrC family response regulator
VTSLSSTVPVPLAAHAPTGARTPILVAEDDLEMRRLIAATLRDEHYEVLEAADGIALLDLIEAAARTGMAYAAIVSDVRMPLLSGMDALAVLQATSADVPVILITAFGDGDTHEEAHELGAFAILDKPFDMSALTTLLAAAVRGA